MDEVSLAQRLIAYDSSTRDGICAAQAFVKGWLEARDVDVDAVDHHGLPVLRADVGAPAGSGRPSIILHGHVDVVPGRPGQFEPRMDGDRLIGRGAYDMKGGLAAMLVAVADAAAQSEVGVHLVVAPDEEADDIEDRATDHMVRDGLTADFAITGEPTDLHVGVQAKGVLAMRLAVSGRAAHGSTPWLGDNAVVKALDVFRRIEALPFSRESSELFDRPSINLARIRGGDVFNRVPDLCEIDVDVRYLPGQDAAAILGEIRSLPDVEVVKTFSRVPAHVSRQNPFVRALVEASRRSTDGETVSVGRHGASDAVSFLAAGIPAVEFGPIGGGHHGPDEWVSVASLERYRVALGDFIRLLATDRDPEPDRVEGGLS